MLDNESSLWFWLEKKNIYAADCSGEEKKKDEEEGQQEDTEGEQQPKEKEKEDM